MILVLGMPWLSRSAASSMADAGELDRLIAKKVIEASPAASPVTTRIALQKSGWTKGINEQMWGPDGSPLKGRGLLQSVNDSRRRQPTKIEVTITGITDAPIGPAIKEVHFTWTY